MKKRKVNTLILLQSKDLLEQWVEELNKFLVINEEPPVYKTKTGREKRRSSVIGTLAGNKNTLTGIIDVAMIGSMYGKGKFNEMIVSDVQLAIANGRTPVILTRMKEQAKRLYEQLQGVADYVFILYGDNTDKENSDVRKKLKEVTRDKSLILVATGQKIGEGFDFPRLDTLMLAAPVSFEGRLEQFVGRLHRDYEGKKDVIVYDYIDSHIRVFEKQYTKRLRTYRKLGYSLITNPVVDKQNVNAIYDSGNYIEIFEQDLVEAENRIIISSPGIEQERVERFIYVVKDRQEAGCKVTVITTNPENALYNSVEYGYYLVELLQNAGIQVITREEVQEHFALIDESLVWHGGMNLLGKEDAWDNLMRIKSEKVAEELLELAFM